MSDYDQPKLSNVPGSRSIQFDFRYSRSTERYKTYGSIQLHQIGDLKCGSKFHLGSHKQTCYEITYIVSGKGWFSTNGVRKTVAANQIYINRPGEVHAGGADPDDPFRYYYLGFSLDPGSEPLRNYKKYPILPGIVCHISRVFLNRKWNKRCTLITRKGNGKIRWRIKLKTNVHRSCMILIENISKGLIKDDSNWIDWYRKYCSYPCQAITGCSGCKNRCPL